MPSKLRRVLSLATPLFLFSCGADDTLESLSSEAVGEAGRCQNISFTSQFIGDVAVLEVRGTRANSDFSVRRSTKGYPAYLEDSSEIYFGSDEIIYDHNVTAGEEYYYTLFLNDGGLFAPCSSTSIWASDGKLVHSIDLEAFRQIDIVGTNTAFDFVSRIPSIVAVKKGALVAFVERRSGPSDAASKTIIMSRSLDNGKTWSAEETIAEDGANSVGNPTTIYDQHTDKITLMFSTMLAGATEASITDQTFGDENAIRIGVMTSSDDGSSWSVKSDITDSISRPDFTFLNVGPGTGAKISTGRYIFPAYHATKGIDSVGESSQAFMIISDDEGASYFGGNDMGLRTDENQIVELESGNLRSFIRYYGDDNYIATADSVDGGLNWSSPRYDYSLPTSIVQQSVSRLTRSDNFVFPRVVLSNPSDQSRRDKLTLKISFDETTSWNYENIIYTVNDDRSDSWVGYSSLVALNDNTIGVLFEKYENLQFSIVFSRYNTAFLSNGADLITRR